MPDHIELKQLFKGNLNAPNISPREIGCWAKGCGCSGTITREHVISDSIIKYFKSSTINLGDKRIKASSGNYFIKNLCQHHNEFLSPFDNEALKLVSGWKRIVTNDTSRITNKRALDYYLYINIDYIEKWFAKTLINMFLFQFLARTPRPNLACVHLFSISQKIFSNESFQPPFGIYMIDPDTPLDPKRRPWTFVEQYAKIIQKNNITSELKEYIVPSSLYVSLGGLELMGFFNVTQFSDDHALNTILKPTAEMLKSKGWYRQKIAVSGGSGTIQSNPSCTPNGHLIFVKSDEPNHPLTVEAIKKHKGI